jgi:two-component system chemotaxis sensor kinase CheA
VDGQQRVELLILQHDIHSIALAVDAVLERQELFVRAVHPDIRHIPGVGAASLLGNGKVVIILDTENLFALARQKPHLLPAPIDGKVSTGCGQKSPVDNGTGT